MRLTRVESRLTVLGSTRARPIRSGPGRENCPISASPKFLSTRTNVRFRPPAAPARNALLDGPILRTLLGLAWPNIIALSAGTCVVIAETSYIGRLGVESLAAMALVFPFVILTMTMSGGAMGGGVASAIARALGAGDMERASALAAHALLIGICFGLTFMLGMLIFGPALLELLGGRGNVLAQRDRLHADFLRRRRAAVADEYAWPASCAAPAT